MKIYLYYSFLTLIYWWQKLLHWIVLTRKGTAFLNIAVVVNQMIIVEVTTKKWRPKEFMLILPSIMIPHTLSFIAMINCELLKPHLY